MARRVPEGAGWEVVPMNGDDRLAVWVIPMPEEIVGSLGPNYFEARPLERRNALRDRAGSAAFSLLRGNDRDELIDR